MKNKNLGYILLSSSLVIGLVTYISFFIINYDLDEDLKIESDLDLNYDVSGANTVGKIDEKNNIIEKKLKSFRFYKKEKNKNYDKIKIYDILDFAHTLSKQWEYILLREEFSKEFKYFTHTYGLEDKTYSWKEEYLPLEIDSKSDKENFIFTLREINKLLKQKKYILTDASIYNFRKSKNGVIKVFDTQLYNYLEFEFLNYFEKDKWINLYENTNIKVKERQKKRYEDFFNNLLLEDD